MKNIILLVCLSMSVFVSCNKDPKLSFNYYKDGQYQMMSKTLNLPEKPFDYQPKLAVHLVADFLRPSAVNSDMATLGRVIFYDKKLSKDQSIACAGCHKQELAFSDDVALSTGVEGRQTARNSFPLGSVANFAAYYGTETFGSAGIPFFWDNRAGTVSEQSKATFGNPDEMGMKMSDVTDMINKLDYYGPLFSTAFGSTYVSEEKVLQALTHFINSLMSCDSKFDKAANKLFPGGNGSFFDYENIMSNNSFSSFTQSENKGKQIYVNKCASCHTVGFGRPILVKANNGLDVVYTDNGIGKITGHQAENGLFKVPTLRNIALTGPYMHDGRFSSLEEVVEHYSTGIKNHPNLSQQLKSNGQPKLMNLSIQDKQDLIAFLNTLTDVNFVQQAKFSDPFKQ